MNTARCLSVQMSLSELLRDLVVIADEFDAELAGIELDSRKIEPGDLFFACKGSTHDGRHYIDAAIEAGASAVLVEQDAQFSQLSLRQGVPVVPVAQLACRISKLAARFFGHPAQALWLIGVTGTNGKTSVTRFIAQAYTNLQRPCGISGTLGHGLYGDALNSSLDGPGTTPDAITVQRIMEQLRQRGAQVMTMEVSSHGLIQKRVNVAEFDVAIFTNLSRDHLDYHGTMDAYGDAKRKLFSHRHLRFAVINLDDVYGSRILNSLAKGTVGYTYSIENPRASVYATALRYHRQGCAMAVHSPWGDLSIDSPLLGAFNVSNLLAALTAVLADQASRGVLDLARIAASFNTISPVRGRMEVIGSAPVAVVVDYAHTPEALKTAIQALRQHFSGRLHCVFGCGGNRDRGKRPMMAAIAEKFADHVMVTDDNPRQESSADIIAEISSGFSALDSIDIEPQRGRAIAQAIAAAAPGDVVLIAGKGHEEYQDVGGQRMVFSDVKQARLCLQERFGQDEAGQEYAP